MDDDDTNLEELRHLYRRDMRRMAERDDELTLAGIDALCEMRRVLHTSDDAHDLTARMDRVIRGLVASDFRVYLGV